MNPRQGFWSPYITLHGVLNESYPPRFFLGFLAAVSVVMLSGCASTDSLSQAVNLNRFDEAISWIEKGADVNELDALGNTPLCNIGSSNAFGVVVTERMGGGIHNEKRASNEEIELATLLIKKGAKVNAKCYVSNTPLHNAALNGFTEIANLLIVNGAKLNVLNDNGDTPLINAYSRGHTETANLLVNNGANVSLKNRQGKSAKDLYSVRREKIERTEEAKREQERREKAESREFWKGAATLVTGVAVGKATSGYTPDQQSRMMSSSMKAVDSGDTSELTQTTNQVKAEQAQSHKSKMQAIEAQKERDRTAQSQNNQSARAENSNTNSSRNRGNAQMASSQNGSGLSDAADTTPRKAYRCVHEAKSYGVGESEADARADAIHFANSPEGGIDNRKTISKTIASCEVSSGKYKCVAIQKFEQDSSSPCGARSGPSAGKSK